MLGYEAFKQGAWELMTEYDSECHKAYFVPKEDIVIEGIMFNKGERVLLEMAWVFPPKRQEEIWAAAGVVSTECFVSSSQTYCKSNGFKLI